MGLIQSITDWMRPRASVPGPADDFWYTNTPNRPGSFNGTSDDAMRITAVYACIRVLAEALGSLPLNFYERVIEDGKEGKQRADAHPLYHVLKYQPNQYQTATEFWEMAVTHCGLRGVFYTRKIYGQRGDVKELIPLNPDRMTVEMLPSRRLRYRYRADGLEREKIFSQDDLFRIVLLTGPDGFTPVSPIAYNADSVGVTDATEKYALACFKNSASPSGVLASDAPITEEVRKIIQDSWNRAHRGPSKAGQVAVLGHGLKFQPITMTNTDSQLLESRRFQLADIARIYRVPLHLIQELSRATFSNIEHQSLDFVIHTIRPWARRIQQAITRDLLLPEEKDKYFAEFMLNDLMSADAVARAQFYQSGIQQGWLTRNEVRGFENLNPLDGLDEPLTPLNMVTQEEKQQQMEMQQQQVDKKNQTNDTTSSPPD